MGGMRECLKILSMNTKRNLVIAVSFRLFLCGNVYLLSAIFDCLLLR